MRWRIAWIVVAACGGGRAAQAPASSSTVSTVSTVTVDEAEVTGSIDKAMIERAVHRKRPELQACFEQALEATPALAATVRVKFTIAADGKVHEAEANGGGEPLDGCVAQVFRQLAFARSTGPATIHYPLRFAPAPPPAPAQAQAPS